MRIVQTGGGKKVKLAGATRTEFVGEALKMKRGRNVAGCSADTAHRERVNMRCC